MKDRFKTCQQSRVQITELMAPSNSNFSGRVHGGHILAMMDSVAFACASKHSQNYCVTASVNTVDFLQPIEVGELVSMKAQVNYVGRTSMVVGIRVESENIQSGKVKHCNSSYFTMVAKDDNGHSVEVPGLILKNEEDLRRFTRSIERIKSKKERRDHFKESNFIMEEGMEMVKNNVKAKIDFQWN
tara:strand:+ start:905 stop:1462 length:558 start_codon:yes stop_codon:yes gene_type:complete